MASKLTFNKSAGAANTVVPSIIGSLFVGGGYETDAGLWSKRPTLAQSLETSATGLFAGEQANVGDPGLSGNWADTLSGKKIRLKVVPNGITSKTAYSAIFGPIVVPEVSAVTATTTSVTFTLPANATVYYVWSASATQQSGSAVKTAAVGASQTLTGLAGSNTFSLINAPTTAGNFYLHMVTEVSSALSSLSVVTTVAIPYTHTVNFVATNNDGLFCDTGAIFDDGGGVIPVDGIWFTTAMWFDGTNWGGAPISIGDSTTGGRYLYMTGNTAFAAYSATVQSPSYASPTVAGWYQVTSWYKRHATITNRIIEVWIWRNELSPLSTAGSLSSIGINNLTRMGLGMRISTTNGTFATFRANSFACGKGNPANLHAFLYNNGAFHRKVTDFDFGSDATCRLLRHWLGAQVGFTTLSGSEAGLTDTQGSGNTWTKTGSPIWSAIVPSFEVAVANVVISSVTVPSGANNTLVVVATIPAGVAWGVLATYLSKVDIWTTRGMGPVLPTSCTQVISGNSCTFTYTLPRSVYASEVVNYVFSTDWVTSGSVSGQSQSGTVTNSSAAADPANWPGISHGTIGWSFTTPTPAGYYADGIPWVTGGVQIASEYPARTTFSGSAVHGAEKNPGRTNTHSFDGRTGPTSYVAPIALPYSLANGDSALKARSNIDPQTNGGYTGHNVYFLQFGGIHARASAPAANEFAPPIVYSVPASRPAGPVINTSALTLPSYSTAGTTGKPTIDTMIAAMSVFNPAPAKWTGVEEKRRNTPSGFTLKDGYGRDVATSVGKACILLIGDDAVNSRRQLAGALIAQGVQWYHDVKATGPIWFPDGGQNQALMGPVALYLGWSGQNTALGTLNTDFGGNELRQTDFVDATLYDYLVTKQAEYVTWSGDTTIPAISTYITRGDGTAEWFIKGPTIPANTEAGTPKPYDPSSGASYRSLNRWAPELMALHSLGFVHSAWAAWKAYVIRANAAATPSFDDLPSHFAVGGLDDIFWSTNWTTISGVSQTVG